MITNVYVDGFNLYYGSLKNTNYKWLNIKHLCEQIFPNDTIHKIRFFTANVRPTPSDLQQPIRQQIYLRALKTLPNLEVHLGQFSQTEVWAPLAKPFPAGSVNFWHEGTPKPPASPLVGVKPDGTQSVRIKKMEEKGSDVNLAAYLLIDAYVSDYDQAIVISNDSDLKVPIEFVNKTIGKPVCILHPCRTSSQSSRARGPGHELKTVASKSIEITTTMLASSQFAQTLIDIKGKIITKPAVW